LHGYNECPARTGAQLFSVAGHAMAGRK
jgi:hypothetical protein